MGGILWSGNRAVTEFYMSHGVRKCSLLERTKSGILFTEVTHKGEIVKQAYFKDKTPEIILEEMLGHECFSHLKFKRDYNGISICVKCPKCKGDISREFDVCDILSVKEVPVVPILICRKCNEKYYSMNKEYIDFLVENNEHLFTPEELEERKKDTKSFTNELNEYIIRIFAAKKIQRLDI